MSEHTWQLLAVVVYFALMLSIGYYAYRRTKSFDGYMLAERGLRPSVAALSANAADMSAWLLMGLPGAVYAAGLIESWIAIGCTLGAWLNWLLVAPRLRALSEVEGDAITIPTFLANRLKGGARPLRIVSALVILVFFTFYVSSGMVAAGKFFVSSFGWPYLAGMVLVTVVTLTYTFFGGFLGATLTDVAQGLLMLAALVAVPLVAVHEIGGWGAASRAITTQLPDAFDLFAGIHDKGPLVWTIGIISTAAWGLGYFGQPHIIVRFMALRSPTEARTARRVSLGWMVLTSGGAVFTALVGIGYFAGSPALPLHDPETVFLLMARIFFHPFVGGLLLAAVLAAIMSTMSSQLVVCSSALVEDLYLASGRTIAPKRLLMFGRLGVLVVAVVAALMALDQDNAVLGLVSFAWAGFGASFGPIIVLSLYWRRLTAWGAMAGMATGAVVVFVWGRTAALHAAMYEIVPGFLSSLLVAGIVSALTSTDEEAVDADFRAMAETLVRR